MEEIQIGAFIRDRRLQLEMTQQQLADKLGVTDKAVSKWERSVSYPDITILRELADALEVSVSELLAGRREARTAPVPPEVENTVLDTVSYAETARKKNSGWRYVLFLVLTACCLQGALVCFIFFWITGWDQGWATIAMRSIALGWAVCYPLLRTERYPIRNALVIASLAVYPFLWSLGLHQPGVLGFAIVSVACAWAVYGAWTLFRRNLLQLTVLVVVLGVILHLSIDCLYVGWRYTSVWGTFEATVLTLGADALCLGGAWALHKGLRFPGRRA